MNCSSRCYSIIWTLVQPSLRITDCRHHFLYGNKYTVDLNISQRRQIKLLSHLAKPAWYKRGTRSNAASSGRTQESTWQSLIANLQVSAACLPNTAVWWWVQWRCERTVVDSLSWQGDLVTLTFWLCWVTYKKKKKHILAEPDSIFNPACSSSPAQSPVTNHSAAAFNLYGTPSLL